MIKKRKKNPKTPKTSLYCRNNIFCLLFLWERESVNIIGFAGLQASGTEKVFFFWGNSWLWSCWEIKRNKIDKKKRRHQLERRWKTMGNQAKITASIKIIFMECGLDMTWVSAESKRICLHCYEFYTYDWLKKKEQNLWKKKPSSQTRFLSKKKGIIWINGLRIYHQDSWNTWTLDTKKSVVSVDSI